MAQINKNTLSFLRRAQIQKENGEKKSIEFFIYGRVQIEAVPMKLFFVSYPVTN